MNQNKGRQAFIDHYRTLFGDDFDAITNSFNLPFLPVLLHRTDKEIDISSDVLPWFPEAWHWPTRVSMGTRLPGVEAGFVYPLSPSSLLPVIALDIHPGDEVFDACAAPGGKTLAMYLRGASIVANDISPDRVARLKRTVRNFGASGKVETKQAVVEILARRMNRTFDKVLIDAPCSSELHVYTSEKHLAQWSKKRIETLHKRQVQMILACLPLLRSGGRLVYSTCALTPEENEQVVNEVLNIVGQTYGLVPVDWRGMPGSTHQNMHRVWPHRNGLEPMFVAAFERKIP